MQLNSVTLILQSGKGERFSRNFQVARYHSIFPESFPQEHLFPPLPGENSTRHDLSSCIDAGFRFITGLHSGPLSRIGRPSEIHS